MLTQVLIPMILTAITFLVILWITKLPRCEHCDRLLGVPTEEELQKKTRNGRNYVGCSQCNLNYGKPVDEKLRTLEEHRLETTKYGKTPGYQTGIECPDCGSELLRFIGGATMVEKHGGYPVFCKSCDERKGVINL